MTNVIMTTFEQPSTACFGLVVVLFATAISPLPLAAQQSTSLRATPEQVSSAFLLRPERLPLVQSTSATAWQTSSPTRGALIGGGIGLVLSSVAILLYVQGTDPGNYSGPVVPIVVSATVVGALIGAAIGARGPE
jgi:hypothetical protein